MQKKNQKVRLLANEIYSGHMGPVHTEQLFTKEPVGPVIDTTVRPRSNTNCANSAVTPFTVLLGLLEADIRPIQEYVSSLFHLSGCHTPKQIPMPGR